MLGQAVGRRLRARLGLAVALLCSVVYLTIVASATAQPGNLLENGFKDPQETNIPYLAWNGEELLLVKCINREDLENNEARSLDDTFATFLITDWSGNPFFKPQAENVSAVGLPFRGEGDQDGKWCWAADFISQKPGLAQIQMTVFFDDA